MAGTIVDHAVWLAGRRRLQAFAKHTGEQMMDASSKHAGVRPPLFPQMPSVWSLDCHDGLGMEWPLWGTADVVPHRGWQNRKIARFFDFA